MIRSGLVSVTFRRFAADEVIRLAAEAGLEGVEWGGDVHVPCGDMERAAEVGRRTKEAGLNVVAYGSYYRAGATEQDKSGLFGQVLETAMALQAPSIRIWAGDRGSANADERHWSRVIDDARRAADLAGQAGIAVAFEYHGNTLTDSPQSAARLLQEADHPNLRTYWQPPVNTDSGQCRSTLEQVIPWLGHLHVFCWRGKERRPLEEGADEWDTYLRLIAGLPGERYALLEFVKDDDPHQFLRDAETLKRLVAAIRSCSR